MYAWDEDNQAMVLSIDMQPGNNIVEFGEQVQAKISEVQNTFPEDVKITTIVNQPHVVKESIDHFMVEFGMAIVSVIIVVMLLLAFPCSCCCFCSSAYFHTYHFWCYEFSGPGIAPGDTGST